MGGWDSKLLRFRDSKLVLLEFENAALGFETGFETSLETACACLGHECFPSQQSVVVLLLLLPQGSGAAATWQNWSLLPAAGLLMPR